MQANTLAFNKVQRTTVQMEEAINTYLQDKSLKFASISESATKGKMFLSLFTSNGGPQILAKVFRDRDVKNVNDKVNEFLKSVQMKLAVQCSSTSYMTLIVFYAAEGTAGKGKARDDQEEDQQDR